MHTSDVVALLDSDDTNILTTIVELYLFYFGMALKQTIWKFMFSALSFIHNVNIKRYNNEFFEIH